MTTQETKQVIAAMLKENTGIHMLDSGGQNGRHWQRNQARSFADEPEATLDGSYGEISVTINLYHFLVNRLEFDADLQARFDDFCEQNPDDGWMSLMDEFATEVMQGENQFGDAPRVEYTYNYETLLSQDIQFIHFRVGETAYVLLQIHNGADARGGMTAPKAFKLTDYDGTGIYDFQRATVCCDHCESENEYPDFVGHWDTYDCNYWETEGDHENLEDFEVTEADKDQIRKPGKLHVTSEGALLCPYCGNQLEAYAYPAD